MNNEKIIKFCESKISEESLFQDESRIQAFKEVIEFVRNYDKPSNTEFAKCKEVFIKVYTEYWSRFGRKLTYRFNKREDKNLTMLINQIKEYLEVYKEQFTEEKQPSEFLEVFLTNMPDWWKGNSFDVNSIARNFNKILNAIITENTKKLNPNDGKGKRNSSNKPTVSEVFASIISDNPE